MPYTSPSASLVSLATTNDDDVATPMASTTRLIPENNRSQKYSRITSPASSASCTSTSTHSNVPPTTSAVASSKPPKDYEQAFAALSLSYGFAGGVPSKAPKGKDKKNKEGKKEKKEKKDKGKKGVEASHPPN